MSDAFRTQFGIDLIDLFALINRIIRTLRLADVAIDTFIGDHQCHGWILRGKSGNRVSVDSG
jgi:hypothetical protein